MFDLSIDRFTIEILLYYNNSYSGDLAFSYNDRML